MNFHYNLTIKLIGRPKGCFLCDNGAEATYTKNAALDCPMQRLVRSTGISGKLLNSQPMLLKDTTILGKI